MNILFVDQFNGLGGGQQCLRDLIPGVIERGWIAHVALPAVGPLGPALAAMGAQVHDTGLGEYTNGSKNGADILRYCSETPKLAHQLKGLIAQFGIDVVYANGPRVLPAAALGGGKLVFHAHSLLNASYAKPLARASLRVTAATAIAACHFVAEPLKACVPSSRLSIVYSGVRDHGMLPRRTPANGKCRVAIIGRVAREKGQTDFLAAARILLNGRAPCEFAIYGSALYTNDSYASEVEELARGVGVQLAGWRDDIGAVLRETDIVAVPSCAIDAAPRVVMEAFSAGVPVVAYASGGLPELIEHNRNGLLTCAATSEALAESIGQLLRDSERRQALGSCARDTYLSRFTVERYRQEVLAILERAAN